MPPLGDEPSCRRSAGKYLNQLTSDNGTSLSYDKSGNRTMSGYTTDTGNRVTSDGTWTYTYDDAGQMVKKSKGSSAETWVYSYDHAGQMTSASKSATDGGTVTDSVSYSFDAFGNRLQRQATSGGTTTTERFAYDGWDTAKPGAIGSENFDVYADLNSSNAVTNRRLFGPSFDEPIARQSSSGVVAWYGTDQLGSVRTVFDNSGTVTGTRSYSGFGEITSETGTGLDRYAYTAREWDGVAGLQYSRARMYDPKIGRWTSEDPIGFGGGDSNLHRYVGNGATQARDPSGLAWDKACVAAELALAGRPELAEWILSNTGNRPNVQLSTYDHWWFNSKTDINSNGTVEFGFSNSLAAKEVAALIIGYVGDSTFHGSIWEKYKDWLHDKIAAYIASGAQNLTDEELRGAYTKHLQSGAANAGLLAANIVRSVYTIPSGAGFVDFVIELSDKDLSELSYLEMAQLLLMLGKFGNTVKNVHIKGKGNAKTQVYSHSQVQEMAKQKTPSATTHNQAAPKTAPSVGGGRIPSLQGNIPDAKKWKQKGGRVVYHHDGSITYIKDGISIKYNSTGYPDFSGHLYNGTGGSNQVRIKLTGSRTLDEAAANTKAGFAKTPDGYTWHHHQDKGLMQLVKEDVHSCFPHSGGFSLNKK